MGEYEGKINYMVRGYTMKRAPKGQDFIAERTNILTGEKEKRFVEVKTGNAKLSKLQMKNKRKKKNYDVVRPWSLI